MFDEMYYYDATELLHQICDIRGQHYSVVLNTAPMIQEEIENSYYAGKIDKQQQNELLVYLQETVDIYGIVED